MIKYKHIPTGQICSKRNPLEQDTSMDYYTLNLSEKNSALVPAIVVEATGSKDWEKIEEEKVKDYEVTGWMGKINTREKIHAVRRLSDGVEFKVGQEVKAIKSEKVFTIKEFKEGATHLKIYVTRFGQDAGLAYIEQLSPLPETKVLFKWN
jgi:hypothetical protein